MKTQPEKLLYVFLWISICSIITWFTPIISGTENIILYILLSLFIGGILIGGLKTYLSASSFWIISFCLSFLLSFSSAGGGFLFGGFSIILLLILILIILIGILYAISIFYIKLLIFIPYAAMLNLTFMFNFLEYTGEIPSVLGKYFYAVMLFGIFFNFGGNIGRYVANLKEGKINRVLHIKHAILIAIFTIILTMIPTFLMIKSVGIVVLFFLTFLFAVLGIFYHQAIVNSSD